MDSLTHPTPPLAPSTGAMKPLAVDNKNLPDEPSAVDFQGLGRKIVHLLGLAIGSTVELKLLRNGDVLVSKCQEEARA